MRVDILMCTYNGEDFIEEQIHSILEQTYADFRLIIVDDISSDRTVDIVRELMLTDQRIEYYQNEQNLGYFNNFLFSLSYVKSEYLFFADQDDFWVKTKIEIQLADLLKEDENVLMNFSNSYLLYDDININSVYTSKRNANQIKKYYTSCIELALRNIVAGHTILIRANQISRIQQRMSKLRDKNNLYFDYVLTLILLEFGTVKYLDQSLVYFRQYPKSTSTVMKMNYYRYVSSNAYAFSQICETGKTVNYFSILHSAVSKKSNFPTYFKFLRQNLLNLTQILNNYDFYKIDVKPRYLKRIYQGFNLSHRYALQK